MRHAETVTFGGSGLDRDALLRADQEKLCEALESEASDVIVFWQGKPLVVDGETACLAKVPWGHDVLEHARPSPVYLGKDNERFVFAADISEWTPKSQDLPQPGFFDPTAQTHPSLSNDHLFVELRGAMARLSPRDAELAATGKSILGWHVSHRYCSKCGHPSDFAMGGWQRNCPSCGASHFPRTDPVVIMLITHGNDVLLGRSPGWPEGMYSLLAGFVEPGETIEAAVRREVFEEANITVGEVGYLACQPWPYPSSLMFGLEGKAMSRDIAIDPQEIEDAVWVSRENVMKAMAGEHPAIKPARKGSIAHFILRNWLADTLI